MFHKLAKHLNFERMQVEALNRPDWPEFAPAFMTKLASIDKSKHTDLDTFDLEAAIKEHPEHLFLKVFAIKKDEVNDNGDAFNADELKKAAHTFVGVPVFTNHQNDDIEKAKGKVVHAWYDEEKGGIWIIARIDKVAYPRIARGIEEGYITGTSMGAQVQYSLCSICHNKAHTADEYCSHVKSQKNKKVSSRVKCAFHESKCKPEDKKCPICGSTKGDEKVHDLKQAQVHEWNYGIKFIEDSLVVNPACHDCTIDCVLNVPHVETKLSQLRNTLKAAVDKADVYQRLKVANTEDHVIKAGIDFFEQSEDYKIAGKIELEKLNEAMNLLEIVARSMLDQKQQVSLEYVSDIADILKTAQEVTDELTEMGYGGLPSPPTINEYLQNLSSGGTAQAAAPVAPQQQQPQQPQMPPPPTGSANLDGVATITKPTFKGSSGKKEELVTAAGNVKDKIEALRRKLAAALAERDATLREGVIDHTNKESGVMEENNTKTAAGPGQTEYAQQVTTEKQLDAVKNESGLLHPRTEKHPEGITQSKEQLGKGKIETDVTSDSPAVRLDNSPEVITEAQMEAVKSDELVRLGTFPEVITEKQWEAMHREIGSVLSEDQSSHITQAQLRDLLSHHTWADEHNPDVVTESQLGEGGFGDGGTAGNLDRLNSDGVVKSASYKYDAKRLVDAAVEAMSDAIVGYSKSPSEVVKAASSLNRNPQAVIKASYIMLVNAVPAKVAARKESRARTAYFAKVAQDNQNYVKPADALVACMADNCRGLRAEDFVEALGFAASSKAVMAQVDARVREKLAAREEIDETPTFDKFDALRKAAESLDRSEDGLYQIQAPLTEVGVDVNDRKAFATAAIKLAMANDKLPQGVALTPVEVSIHTKAEIPHVAVTLAETTKLSADQRSLLQAKKLAAVKAVQPNLEKRAEARKTVEKTAQMGGGMPDQMGGAPGAGAAGGPGGGMPPAAGAQQPPAPGVESFDQNPMGDEATDTADLEPKAPGSVCPVCTSEDVDIVEGKGKCKSCTAEFTYKVQIDVTKWPNTLDKGESAEGEEGGMGGEEGAGGAGGDMQGEGFAMPEQGGTDQSIPVAAMTRLNKNVIEKLAEIKDRVTKAAGNPAEMQKLTLHVKDGGLGISVYNQKSIVAGNYMLGNISPLTGSTNTVKLASGAHICLDTGTPYVMETAVSKDDPSRPWVQWKWFPKVAGRECSSCSRVKKAFVAALKLAGKTEDQFEAMDLKSRGELILQMKSAGAFKVVKTASKAVNALSEFKVAYAMPTSKFPMESCRQKLAERFGVNTVAMSGPCEGSNLADCVCKSLKKAEVYADYLAVKVAGVWALEDASVNCLEDFVREGFKLAEAQACCEALKMKYAQSHEHFLDDMDNGGGMGGDAHPADDGGGHLPPDDGGDADPFDGGDMGGGDAAAPVDTGAPADGMGGGSAPMAPAVEVQPPAGDVMAQPGAPAVGGGVGGGPTVKLELPLDTVLDAVKDSHMGTNPGEVPGDAQMQVEVPAQKVDDAADVALEQGGGDPHESDPAAALPEENGESDVPVEDNNPTDSFGDDDNNTDPAAEHTSFEAGGNAPEGDDVDKEKAAFANSMKPATIGRTGKIRMDLSNVLAAVKKARQTKTAEEGKKLDVEQAQDAVPFKYDGGKTLGNEDKFTAEKPDVPSNESQSTMGHENPPKAEMPKVPTGDQRLGHEESHLKPELGNKVTGLGGSEGEVVAQSKFPYKGSTKDITYTLAARIKAASEKKVDNHVPTSETDGIGTIQDGKVHPNAAAEKPFSADEPEVPEKNKGAFMGHEEESIHDVPKPTSEFAPTVPTEKADKVDEVTGTVAASSSAKSQQYKEAMALAGRMVAEGHIQPEELMATVSELREYSPKMLKAFANRLFTNKPKLAARKGLNTVSDGTEQPVVINQTDAKKANLSQRIAGLFTLTKQLDNASDDDADLRRKFRR